eukprot:TRINITY_DN26058_c0_g1_i1.p1 TRINITY_DN26058_c0_g1~~TRINITY_DN26058_c0_g1_i1.p1  ORF type:complete len:386 (-),score=85.39 TRINITY_DN26058_c0_g1_i1:247-1344(-)
MAAVDTSVNSIVKKQLTMDKIHYHGQDVSVGMEEWVATYQQQSEMLSAHSSSIAKLEKLTQKMEQQVKAIAHVMASNNLHKLQEDRAADVEGMRATMEKRMTETKEEIIESLRREVFDFTTKKHEFAKRIDAVDEKLSDMICLKQTEAANHRAKLESNIDKVNARCAIIENSIQTEIGKFKDMCNVLSAQSTKAVRAVSSQLEEERNARDKANQAKSFEIERTLNGFKNTYDSKVDDLKKHIEKLEFLQKEGVRTLGTEISREVDQRSDLARNVAAMHRDIDIKIEIDLDRAMKKHDLEAERKMTSFARYFPELKMALAQERTDRTHDVDTLKRELAKERKDRDLDDHRILAMIKSTLTSIQKMH